MKSFEEFVDYLSAKGVKSFHIELHEPQREDKDQKEWREEFEKWKSYRDTALGTEKVPHACTCLGKGETVTDQLKTTVARVPSVAELQEAADEKRAAVLEQEAADMQFADSAEKIKAEAEAKAKAAAEAKAKADAEEYERRVVAKMEEQKKEQAAEEAAKLAKAEEKKAAKAKKAEAKMEAKAETKAENPSILEPGKSAYDMFCEKISSDDGTFTKEQRAELIGLMKLDELLRVNNDFSLGLDTDKPVEDVRKDVIGCF